MNTNTQNQVPPLPEHARERLEYLRNELRAECISYGELHELQSLIPFIDSDDVELLEAAGVPEMPERARLRWLAKVREVFGGAK